MKLQLLPSAFVALFLVAATLGCSLFPAKYERDRIHNPFPQLKRVAILPFYNQSDEPTVDTDLVAEKYYGALQSIPGFEVLPVGAAKAQWQQYAQTYGEPRTGQDFQRLAQQMGVEALVVGSVTDFSAYYPPRLAMTVHWYASNEGFHPIPSGYGLPWGTEQEDHIPQRIVREAEFDLARSQLATQTPLAPGELPTDASNQISQTQISQTQISQTSGELETDLPPLPPEASFATPALIGVERGGVERGGVERGGVVMSGEFHDGVSGLEGVSPLLPEHWPNATDLIPDPPVSQRPIAITNHDPVLTHTRLYRGDDPYFTNRLANHVESGDDARPVSWQGYLRRSDDFISFCCQLHITEMLESRGGRDQSDLILRWPLSRY